MPEPDEQPTLPTRPTQAASGAPRAPLQPIAASNQRSGSSTAIFGGTTQQPASGNVPSQSASSAIPHTQPVAGAAQPTVAGQPAPAATAAGGPGGGAAPPGNPVHRQGGSGPANAQPGAGNATLDAVTAANCAKTLSTFRSGRISRSDAISEITGHIQRGGGRAEDIVPYVDAICQHFCQAVIARAAGATRAAAAPAQPAPAPQPAAPAPAAAPVVAGPPVAGRRMRSASPASSQQLSADEDDDDGADAPDQPQDNSRRKRPSYDSSLAHHRLTVIS